MKILIYIIALMGLGVGYSNELNSTVILSSNYIYRGLSYYSTDGTSTNILLNSNPSAASGSPVIQASLDYSHKGFGVSVFTGPVDSYNYGNSIFEKDEELDVLSYYTKSLYNMDFTISINYYGYIKNTSNNEVEYATSVAYKSLKYDLSYVNDYSGSGTSSTYNKITIKPYIVPDKLYVNTHLGYAYYSQNIKVMESNYFDYIIGIGYNVDQFTVDLYYSNTFDRKLLYTNTIAKKDASITVSVSKTFNLFK